MTYNVLSVTLSLYTTLPEEICNKSMHVYPPHLFTPLIPYLVKIMSQLPVFTLCLKSGPFTVSNKFARCHPNLIILADTCQKNFVTKLLRHSPHQTWLINMSHLYLVKRATI